MKKNKKIYKDNEYYKESIDNLLKAFNSNIHGLTEEEVIKNRKRFGNNVIKEKKKKTKVGVFFSQFLDLLVIVLIVAALLSLLTGGVENTIVILVVITLNAILGTIEYFKAQNSIDSLKEMINLTSKVIRNNMEITIDCNDIVCGDIILYEAGDVISSDARIIDCKLLEVDESSLTGESIPQEKNNLKIDSYTLLADQKNMLFRGTKVLAGKVKAIVCNIGEKTEIGKIASLLQDVKKDKSPLTKSIEKFSFDLALIIILVCIIVFIIGIYQNIALLDSLMFSISLAVAAIPEALQTIVTIVLAISTEKMAKSKAIVKEMHAVETLGNIDIIATDKTGTITQNKMVVSSIYIENEIIVDVLTFCNDVIDDYINNQETTSKVINTDRAIAKYLVENYTNIKEIKDRYEIIKEIPFTSSNKYSCVTVRDKSTKKIYNFYKGGSDIVLNKCNLNLKEYNKYNELINTESNSGKRVLAVAYKELISSENDFEFYNLTLAGIVSLIDPPKENVKEAIKECINNGCTPIMITGDNINTAKKIATDVGILTDDTSIIDGIGLSNLSDEELLRVIDNIKVYARVTPKDKIRIVEMLKVKGHCVGYLGDGVNDAPAIRKADVGISMGISGTEVSKEASQMILLDDNYETITKAIKKGRNIYTSIQNAILYLIAGNIAGIFIVLYTTLFHLPMPFAPVHLLFINLINDSLPAIAIGVDESAIDNSKPRDKGEMILSKAIIKRITIDGMIIAICTMISYYIGYTRSSYVSRTMVFVTIAISRLFYSLNCRGKVKLRRKPNRILLFSIITGISLVLILIFVKPLSIMFSIETLTRKELFYSIILAIIPNVVIQIIYRLKYKFKNKSRVKS